MSQLTPDELAALQDPESWDLENVQHGEPVPNAGAVYRVRLHGEDLRRITAAARQRGVLPSELIRQAARAQADQVLSAEDEGERQQEPPGQQPQRAAPGRSLRSEELQQQILQSILPVLRDFQRDIAESVLQQVQQAVAPPPEEAAEDQEQGAERAQQQFAMPTDTTTPSTTNTNTPPTTDTTTDTADAPQIPHKRA